MHTKLPAWPLLILAMATTATAENSALPNQAEEHPNGVEIAFWNRSYHGTVGAQRVQLHDLRREATHVGGRYCYGSCGRTDAALMLDGTLDGDTLTLHETENTASGRLRAPGDWRLQLTADGATGTWHSPDGRRTLPVALQLDATPEAHFPYELRLVADALPAYGDDSCNHVPVVSAIRLYRDGRLVQELATESRGTCGMFTPQVIDMDFDGWPDLTLATSLPAGPNIPHDSWLFDVKRQRFVAAPQSLQDVTSAEFDPAHGIVYHFWRSGAAMHGIDTYRWRNGELKQVDSQQSYSMPVRRAGKLGYYYVMPVYRDGHISFDPLLLRGRDGRLLLQTSTDEPELYDDAGTWGEANALQVWRAPGGGKALQRVESHSLQWKPLATPQGPRWCADVTYFDVDTRRIGRALMTGESACLDTNPNE